MSDINSFVGYEGDINSFGGSAGAGGPHAAHALSFESDEAGNRLTISFEGTREQLFGMLNGSKFFSTWNGAGADSFPAGGSTTSNLGYSYPYLARARIRRVRGPVCEAAFMIHQVRVAGRWGLDFAEISKPILAWFRPGTNSADTNERNRPDLQKIKIWQKLGAENPASPDYSDFKADGKKMSGATLTLAKMIYRGIESFPVYMPVVTWQCRVLDPPDVNIYMVGNQMAEVAAPNGIEEIGSKNFLGNINALTSPWTGEPFRWVRSGSRVTTNPDATYMWTMQFLAVEKADSDLYPEE